MQCKRLSKRLWNAGWKLGAMKYLKFFLNSPYKPPFHRYPHSLSEPYELKRLEENLKGRSHSYGTFATRNARRCFIRWFFFVIQTSFFRVKRVSTEISSWLLCCRLWRTKQVSIFGCFKKDNWKKFKSIWSSSRRLVFLPFGEVFWYK